MFEAMLTGWARQQRSRMLGDATVRSRERLVRRFTEFAESYPWAWMPSDVEDFTVSLTSGVDKRALSDDPRLPPGAADVLRLPDRLAL